MQSWKDFDGDGSRDLAIGVPGETIGVDAAAGGVHVLYGSPGGPTAAGDQFWNQGSPGVASNPMPGERFGFAVAAGDFDGDGCGDLVSSARGQKVSGVSSAGAVHVLYGTPAGLSGAGSQYWHQDVADILDTPAPAEFFGYDLDTGYLNDDDYADLAISVLFEGDTGAVAVLYGSPAGLTASGNELWSQDSPGIRDAGFDCQSEFFGTSISIGDYDNDSFGDLAVGVPGEDLGDAGGTNCGGAGYLAEAGAINVIYGSAAGLTAAGDQFLHQNKAGVMGTAGEGDDFGQSLGRGDFDNDGVVDLAIGVTGEDPAGMSNAGAVNVLYGSGAGLTAAGDQYLHQGTSGVLDAPDTDESFGFSLVGADFGQSAHADLAIGVPNEEVLFSGAGAVNVLYGSNAGLSSAADQFWTQGSAGVADAAERDDAFGRDLGRGDYADDGGSDLVIGVPFEDDVGYTEFSGTGAVHVLFGGGADGLTGAGSQLWTQGTPGVLEIPEQGDDMGTVIAGSR
ncbi:MAG: hypothetical protein WEA10_03475 [Actinomycetota bacterium]